MYTQFDFYMPAWFASIGMNRKKQQQTMLAAYMYMACRNSKWYVRVKCMPSLIKRVQGCASSQTIPRSASMNVHFEAIS